jgi:hypothetical protein
VADSTFDDIAKVVSFLSNMESIGSPILALFGVGVQTDDGQIVTDVVNGVTTAFAQLQESGKLTDALAAQQSAMTFLQQDYKDASGESAADLYDLLAKDRGAQLWANVQTAANDVRDWSPADKTQAGHAVSLYLLLAITDIAFYQERARRGTAQEAASDHANIVSAATIYHRNGKAMFDDAVATRMAAVGSIEPITANTVSGATFHDTWGGTDVAFDVLGNSGGQYPTTSDPAAAIVAVRDNYLRLLHGDLGCADAIAFQVAFCGAFRWESDIAKAVASAATFGSYYADSTTALAKLSALVTAPMGAPAQPNDNANLHVFARAHDGSLQFIEQSAGSATGWTAWTSLGGTVTDVTLTTNSDGSPEVFARDANGMLVHAWRDASQPTGWSALASLGGPVGSFAVRQNGSGQLEVIARAADRTIQHIYQNGSGGSGWSGWSSIGGPVGSAVALGRNADGYLEAFGLGDDNALHHCWQDPQTVSGWTGWSSLGGWSSAITVASNMFACEEVFACGSDGGLYHMWQDCNAQGGWSDWNRLADSARFLTVVPNADGHLEAFYCAGDDKVYHLWQSATPSPSWQGPTAIDDRGMDRLVVGRNADGRLEAFARGTADGQLYHAWQTADASSGWTSFAPLGGNPDEIAVAVPQYPLSLSGGPQKYRIPAIMDPPPSQIHL